jgi:hypothetical protein
MLRQRRARGTTDVARGRRSAPRSCYIGGNKYRLIARIRYARAAATPPLHGIVYVLFIVTHKEYDALDVGAL